MQLVETNITAIASLDERIATALSKPQSSAQLQALLSDAAQAAQTAADAASQARERALDPATRPAEVAMARKVMEDSQFASIRLDNAAEKLKQLVTEATKRERDTAVREERAAALAERDELAKDLKEYAKLSDRMVILLTRLSRNNRRLGGNHRSAGSERSAEAIARGVEHLSHHEPSIVDSTKLISFAGSQFWPPHNQHMWVEYP